MRKGLFLCLLIFLSGCEPVSSIIGFYQDGKSGSAGAAAASGGVAANEPATVNGAAASNGAAAPGGSATANGAAAAGRGGPAASDGQAIKLTKEQLFQGDLILINKDYALHKQGVEPDIVKLSEHPELMQGYGLLDTSIRLSAGVAKAFSNMVSAAAEEHVDHFLISSGYRSFGEQEELYKQKGSDYALPAGFSEHNSGLALDIGSSLGQMERAPEGAWLKKNAWKYGFILRYPEDKTAITGIQYEPWHFRYVGLPHSAVMQSKNYTLEQYLDDLRQEKNLTATVNGIRYEIEYVPASDRSKLVLPKGLEYTVSGDNMGGYIVTVTEETAKGGGDWRS